MPTPMSLASAAQSARTIGSMRTWQVVAAELLRAYSLLLVIITVRVIL